MKRIKCTIAYDGRDFFGFQIQPSQRTVQGELEQALKKIHKGNRIRLHASGRTDTGVHAIHQVFHFDTGLEIPVEGWKNALASLIPPDIQMIHVEKVPNDFHARFSAVEKEYRYYVLNQSEPDVFRRHYMYHTAATIQINKMKEACTIFEGTHDFTSFASARSTARGSKVRTLTEVRCQKEGNTIEFVLRGNGFLQHMVRIIIGALLEVGEGKRTAEELASILAQQDRTNAGVTLPPQGLYLWNVIYA